MSHPVQHQQSQQHQYRLTRRGEVVLAIGQFLLVLLVLAAMVAVLGYVLGSYLSGVIR